MCLRDQGIDDNNGVFGRVRQARGISNDNGGVRRGQGIDDETEGLETTTEAAGVRDRDKGIYDDDRGAGGGI